MQRPHELGEPAHSEPFDSTHTGTRPLVSSQSARTSPRELSGSHGDSAGELPSQVASTRASIRPSAFGLPPTGSRRKLQAAESVIAPAQAASAPTDAVEQPSAIEQSEPSLGSSGIKLIRRPRVEASEAKERPAAIKADIEELLPISQAVKSLPRPPRMPQFDSQPPPPPARRFPWASLVFGLVLAASLAPLFHYSGMRGARPEHAAATLALATTPLPLSRTGTANVRELVDGIERELWGQPERQRATLLAEGERALELGNERLAEALFGRAYELDTNDARAQYGLARVRLAQADLEGAEGWLLSAIAKQPREAAYRILHADLLDRRNRHAEAELERALSRSLANFAAPTPAR